MIVPGLLYLVTFVELGSIESIDFQKKFCVIAVPEPIAIDVAISRRVFLW